ncbi:DUF4214 domain-containing protein [Roseomonas sp. SSH11]|uniref:DUF4214 domain-containing protein n=1 Tax=Pararoseomonas baculiformis TaxID=2820812 RepID=A0ABS4AC89_9PROT|nr:DUF4214 domain-containing protein [Pararoseomonas baculiformis]MBP0444621.1 DUF4214 domain-containing protein [Pararoseomonas baculiformis]
MSLPGEAAGTTKPVFTLAQVIEQLESQWGWFGYPGVHLHQPAPDGEITFTIPTIRYTPLDTEAEGWLPPSPTLLQQARLAFALWDDLIAPSIVEIPLDPDGADPDSLPESSAAITLGRTRTTSGDGTYATDSSSVPITGPGDYPLKPSQIWLSSNWSTNTDPGFQIGYYGLQTIVHEIGHSLGLSHPGLYNADENRDINYALDARYAQDTRKYTVMSYFDADADGSGTWHRDASGHLRYGSTPLLHDIAAIQAKYGADMTTRVDDTVYGFNSTAGRPVFDFSVNHAPVVAIWDAGGRDTLDLSGYAMSQSIDLREGAFSHVGGLTYNLAIAFGAEIEDAIGGTGSDRITGNALDNFLSGMAGNDLLIGLDGDDTLMGYTGDDVLQGGTGSNAMDGGAGYDVVDLRGLGRRGDIYSAEGIATGRVHATGTDEWVNVETALYADGRMVFDAEDTAARILRLYEAALDRSPDQFGLRGSARAVETGMTLTSLAEALVTSTEFSTRFGASLSNGDFVEVIHRNLFGYGTDAANHASWTANLNAGAVSRAGFVTALADSSFGRDATAETLAAGIWELSEKADFLARLYTAAFDRAPDIGGLSHWRGQMTIGATELDIANVFTSTDVFQARYGALDNGAFVENLYLNALNRAVDGQSRDVWLSRLEAGTSRSTVVLALANSEEMWNLTAEQIRSENPEHYGIAFA